MTCTPDSGASGEVPADPVVDGPERERSAVLDAAVLEHPGPLRAREVRVEHEPGRARVRAGGGPARRAPRSGAQCGGPARRWPGGRAGRWCGPRPLRSRVGWRSRSRRRLSERLPAPSRAPPAWSRRGTRSRPRRARRGPERGSAGELAMEAWRRRSSVSSTASARTPEVPASIAITTATGGTRSRSPSRRPGRCCTARPIARSKRSRTFASGREQGGRGAGAH